jgi:membrane-bound serine protease (ClpP class)
MTLAILLLGLGLALIIAEVLFPSFGVLGGLATLSIIGGIVSAFSDSNAMGMNFLIATAVLIPAVIMLGFKLLPHSPVAKHLVVGGFSFEDGAGIDRRDVGLEGLEGVVESSLRPAGTARIDGRRVDVVTRGEMLDVGTEVRVMEVRGNRVVVARIEAPRDERTAPASNEKREEGDLT